MSKSTKLCLIFLVIVCLACAAGPTVVTKKPRKIADTRTGEIYRCERLYLEDGVAGCYSGPNGNLVVSIPLEYYEDLGYE